MGPNYPGSVVERGGRSARAFFDGLFFGTNGLLLMQVREITGLETPVIQNWINREWVPRPVKKRYGPEHLGRILLINALRSCTRLEDLARLLRYINGDTNDRGDDIISDNALYIALCEVIEQTEEGTAEDEAISAAIDRTGLDAEYHDQLFRGMRVLLQYYRASAAKAQADALLEALPHYAGKIRE